MSNTVENCLERMSNRWSVVVIGWFRYRVVGRVWLKYQYSAVFSAHVVPPVNSGPIGVTWFELLSPLNSDGPGPPLPWFRPTMTYIVLLPAELLFFGQ